MKTEYFNYNEIINQKFGRLLVLGNGKKPNSLLCKCDCGKVVSIDKYHLRAKHTRSCGCLRIESVKKSEGYTSYLYFFDKYKRAAKDRNLEFNITFDQFKEITNKNCHYCNDEPKDFNRYVSQKKIKFNKETKQDCIDRAWIKFNGIDRIDNFIGYLDNNIVPCCSICNRMKSAQEKTKFLDKIRKIYNNLCL